MTILSKTLQDEYLAQEKQIRSLKEMKNPMI